MARTLRFRSSIVSVLGSDPRYHGDMNPTCASVQDHLRIPEVRSLSNRGTLWTHLIAPPIWRTRYVCHSNCSALKLRGKHEKHLCREPQFRNYRTGDPVSV